MKSWKRDRRKEEMLGENSILPVVHFALWHVFATLLLYPRCTNAWRAIHLTGCLECYTWKWRKGKQNGQLGYCQGTVWASCPRTGVFLGQTRKEVRGQVQPHSLQSENRITNRIFWTRPLKLWGKEIFPLLILTERLCSFPWTSESKKEEKRLQSLATVFLLTVRDSSLCMWWMFNSN